jgi:NADPH:quinone reductase-like Zn-dependent oxidoreductase
VGHFAVQFAKDRGAHVIVTARIEDGDLLRRLGADEIIDYQRERFEDCVHDIDLVFDLVGGETQRRSWKVLRHGGRMVSTLQPPSQEEAARHDAHAEAFMAKPDRGELSEIARMIDDGKVCVFIQHTLPLEEVRRAHDHLEHEHARGKVVLAIGAETAPAH